VPEVPFSALVKAIQTPGFSPKSDAKRLRVAAVPTPFVDPNLIVADPATAFRSEIIFVGAPAAVGKSTAARYLSGTQNIPILDLSQVPVSTGSLRTLLLELGGPHKEPVDGFHDGEAPIIIDAIDEGRLRSGETGVESFLETTAELLLESRLTTNRPKIIFFGRFDSIDLAKASLELYAPSITTTSVSIDFFGREQAWKLIDAYAQSASKDNSAYSKFREPARDLIEAYFKAIAAALGHTEEELWTTEQGKAFAGYAPILEAVGTMLARLDNFQEVTNRLNQTGTHEAWQVIETVLNEIFDREKGKLCDQLKSRPDEKLPPELYDDHEQAVLLAQYVAGKQLAGSGRVQVTGPLANKYAAMVQQYVPEHPFVRQRQFSNSVLGSVVMARAISGGKFQLEDHDQLKPLSRQPFLWRSISSRLNEDKLLHGDDIGYLLNSFWSDPLTLDLMSSVISMRNLEEDDLINVRIPLLNRSTCAFFAYSPVKFYGQLKDADIDIGSKIVLVGDGERGGGATFLISNSTVICSEVEVASDRVRLHGRIWMEAEIIAAPTHLQIHKNGSEVGWGGRFAEQFPWNREQATLDAPYQKEDDDNLTPLVRECVKRFPGGITLMLASDYTSVPNDPQTKWIDRRFSEAFPTLIRVMHRHGLAETESYGGAGTAKARVRFSLKWSDFLEELEHSGKKLLPETFITEAREEVG